MNSTIIANWWNVCKLSEKCVAVLGSEVQFESKISKFLLVRTLQLGTYVTRGIEELLNSETVPAIQKLPVLMMLDPCQYGMRLHPSHMTCLPIDPNYPGEDVFNPDNPSIVIFSLVMLLLSFLMVLTVCVLRRIDLQKK